HRRPPRRLDPRDAASVGGRGVPRPARDHREERPALGEDPDRPAADVGRLPDHPGMIGLAFLTAALLVPAAPARAAATVAVVVAGRPLDPVPSYAAGGELYLDAKRVGSIYGGQVYSYPVSGRVQLTLRGRTLQFLVDSKKATSGDQNFDLSAPVIVRVSQAFLPVSL